MIQIRLIRVLEYFFFFLIVCAWVASLIAALSGHQTFLHVVYVGAFWWVVAVGLTYVWDIVR